MLLKVKFTSSVYNWVTTGGSCHTVVWSNFLSNSLFPDITFIIVIFNSKEAYIPSISWAPRMSGLTFLMALYTLAAFQLFFFRAFHPYRLYDITVMEPSPDDWWLFSLPFPNIITTLIYLLIFRCTLYKASIYYFYILRLLISSIRAIFIVA